MHSKSDKACILIFSILLTVSVMPSSFAVNYDGTYNCSAQFGLDHHKLYVSVPASLYDYYHGELHSLSADGDYAGFVTPDAVATIAMDLRNATLGKRYADEEFANAVLSLVHQVPYVASDVKYPVETLVDNGGDCDTVSLLAASIMKAGGLDVVLLYYKDVGHMNVGVYLPQAPYPAWLTLASPTGFEHDGKEYWVAECTPKDDWKVGQRPDSLAGEEPTIISLENCEKSSPARVMSNMDIPLTPSSISINLSADIAAINEAEQKMVISGLITPSYSGQTIVMYLSKNGTFQGILKTVTDYDGSYFFKWGFTSAGTYQIKTCWSGVASYAGADSEALTVFIGFPESLVQFEAPDYDFIVGNPMIASYELGIRQGVKDFLNISLSGTGVSLSGEFIILRNGQAISIKGSPLLLAGQEPLRLPEDFTKNDQFCFILQRNGESSYNVTATALENCDVPQMKQNEENGVAFMNASKSIRENTWYTIAATISDNGTIAEIRDINGNILESALTKDAANISELGILITNSTDKAIAFRDLKIETLNKPVQPLDYNINPANEGGLPTPYINLAIVLSSTFAAVVYVWKRKKTPSRP